MNTSKSEQVKASRARLEINLGNQAGYVIWKPVEDPSNKDFGLRSLIFSDKLSFEQRTHENTATCFVSFPPRAYQFMDIQRHGQEFWIRLRLTKDPSIEFWGNEGKAKELPLSKVFSIFQPEIRICLVWTDLKPKVGIAEHGHGVLVSVLTRNSAPTDTPEDTQAKERQQQKAARRQMLTELAEARCAAIRKRHEEQVKKQIKEVEDELAKWLAQVDEE